MFAQPYRGRARGGCPKAEATELAPEAVGVSPPERWDRAEGLRLLGTATGEIPERRLWAEKHAPSKWFLSCIAQQAPQGRTRAIEEALHPGAFASAVVIFADRLSSAVTGAATRAPQASMPR